MAESSTLNSPVDGPDDGQRPEGLDDDAKGLHVNDPNTEMKRPIVAPRWPTRVFAIESLLKIISACETDPVHFDLVKAKVMKVRNKGEGCISS